MASHIAPECDGTLWPRHPLSTNGRLSHIDHAAKVTCKAWWLWSKPAIVQPLPRQWTWSLRMELWMRVWLQKLWFHMLYGAGLGGIRTGTSHSLIPWLKNHIGRIRIWSMGTNLHCEATWIYLFISFSTVAKKYLTTSHIKRFPHHNLTFIPASGLCADPSKAASGSRKRAQT